MNKIKDEEIMNILNTQMKFLYSIYDETRILGIFTHGLANYGFAEEEKDIQTIVFYLPSFEEMCYKSFEPKIIQYKNKKIQEIDFRTLYQYIESQDHKIMEALFSEYYIINPRYQKAFKKYIQVNKEAIYRCDPKKKVEDIVNRAFTYLSKYNNGGDELFQACRLRIVCRMYLDGISCENCINLKKDYHINYLWQIKNAELIPDIEEVKTDLNHFLLEAKDLKANNNYKDLIKKNIIEIMKIALTDMTQQSQDFLTVLTDMEKQALEIILDNLEDRHEGNISISQLVIDSSISRPVFKNVLQKMKENLIAEVENKGVKGTYVKIIDGVLLSQ